MSIQSVGDPFDLKKLFRARDVARDITYELSSHIRPGMTEADAHALYKTICKNHPVEKQWHPAKLRFGPNTTCDFKDVSVPHVLGEEDIFFIDIGPVVDGHEADYGETFVVGNQYEHKLIMESSRKIFDEVSAHWKKTKATGIPLYEFAKERARSLGYILSMGSDGHRIGDFPHHVHFKGSLLECEEDLIPNVWILEIHLWDPQKRFGAFYEDILSDEIP